jgi:uncharacterized membrane protein
MNSRRGDEPNMPKTKLWGMIVIVALIVAILLLATGAVKFGPF